MSWEVQSQPERRRTPATKDTLLNFALLGIVGGVMLLAKLLLSDTSTSQVDLIGELRQEMARVDGATFKPWVTKDGRKFWQMFPGAYSSDYFFDSALAARAAKGIEPLALLPRLWAHRRGRRLPVPEAGVEEAEVGQARASTAADIDRGRGWR
ncbi:MAG: hypothetical protein IKC51_10250 [Myxococcaceae bacterium]|nr:hypothetical protein [Myxococcaceae bacterium]